MITSTSPGRPETCPRWCALRHGQHPGEDDTLHLSGALMVRRTVLRLCMTHDPDTDVTDGPFVLVGAEEYSVHEAEALIDALTQLVEQGSDVSLRAGA